MDPKQLLCRAGRLGLLVALLLCGWNPQPGLCQGGAATAGPDPRSPAPRLPLLEDIEFEGLIRTQPELARSATGLTPGDPIGSAELLEAEDRLRASRLFGSVRSHTRRGSEPGKLRAVFVVEEARPHFRFGLGHQDLTGWYLVPIELNLDNFTGRGERASISTRIGLRTGGLFTTWRRPSIDDERSFQEIGLRAAYEDRLYFYENVEVRHRIGRGGLDLRLGRALPARWQTESWLSFEGIDADSSAKVHRTDPARDREQGDVLEFSQLPPSVQSSLSRHGRVRGGVSLLRDGRMGRALDLRGTWIRVQGEWIGGNERRPILRGDVDARAYVPLGNSTQLALRSHFQSVTARAPFYERPYLGGLYTVRGYPSQSLSPPAGDRHLLTTGLEVRGTWIGPPDDPHLVGLAFVDGGWGWQEQIEESRGAVGVGYGIRVAIPWIGRLGIDVGHPLSDAPVEDSFHINGGIGWTF